MVELRPLVKPGAELLANETELGQMTDVRLVESVSLVQRGGPLGPGRGGEIAG